MSSPTAIAEVQNRILQIQSRFGTPAPTAGDFANSLASAMGQNVTDSSVTGDDVVADARKYLGIPYVWGGTDPAKGLDCSGLVQRVYKDMGIDMPRLADAQARQGTAVPSLAQAKPGDLVAFGSPVDHIGIYIGNNQMIVAPKTGDVVKVQNVYQTPTAIRRIIPDAPTASAGGGLTAASFASSLGGATGGGSIGGALNSRFNSLFTAAGAKYGISPTLLAAVAKQESGFNPNAGSGAGAKGLMQFMPATAKSMGVNPMDPASAIDGAARMLKGLVDKFGSPELALAGYNAGAGAVQKYHGIPPYKETQNYVKNIMSMMRQAGG